MPFTNTRVHDREDFSKHLCRMLDNFTSLFPLSPEDFLPFPFSLSFSHTETVFFEGVEITVLQITAEAATVRSAFLRS